MSDFLAQNAEHLVTLAMILVGLPVILGCSLEAFRVWTRHRETMAEALNAQAAEKAAQYAAQTGLLESRVRVLERIATDRGADLSSEIELLRDDRAVSQA